MIQPNTIITASMVRHPRVCARRGRIATDGQDEGNLSNSSGERKVEI